MAPRLLSQVFEDILSGELPRADTLSECERDFFNSLLAFRPDRRATAADALMHSWLATAHKKLPELSPSAGGRAGARGRPPRAVQTGCPAFYVRRD